MGRVKTRRDAEPALADLEVVFNYTSHFLKAVALVPEDENIYTEVEIKTLVDALNATVTWENETVLAESLLKPYEDPVLIPKDIKMKMDSLNREVGYLYNKARNAKPKKKKTEEKKESEKTKSEEGAKDEETIKTAEDSETVGEKPADETKETATEQPEAATTTETPKPEETTEKEAESETPRNEL